MYVARASTLLTKEAETIAPKIMLTCSYIWSQPLTVNIIRGFIYPTAFDHKEQIVYSEMKHAIMIVGECISKTYILHDVYTAMQYVI